MLIEEEKVQKNMLDHLHFIQSRTNIPDDILDIAKEIYKDYLSITLKSIKGNDRKLQFCCACILYASKTMNSGALSQSYLIEKVFDNKEKTVSFQWACKDLQDRFLTDKKDSKICDKRSKDKNAIKQRFKHLFYIKKTNTASQYIDIMTKKQAHYIYEKTKEKKDYYKHIFKLVHRLLSLLESNDADFVATSHPEKLIASLLFVASKILQYPIKLKDMALLFHTSEPIFFKVESKILPYLVNKTKFLS